MVENNIEAYEIVLQGLRSLILNEPNTLDRCKDDIRNVASVLEDRKIRHIFSICSDLLSSDPSICERTPIFHESLNLAIDVRDVLTKEWIDEAQNLCTILNRDHFQALLWAHDIVANKQYEPSLPDELENSSLDISSCDDELASVKIVQVIKNQEPLGATVTFEDQTGNIVISRVIHGGAAHRSGLINVGDCICEVNGYNLKGRSFMEILSMLEQECRNSIISFKLLPNRYRSSSHFKGELNIRLKALFDYFPSQDLNHPCPEAGLAFKKGDILHVVSMDEEDWWQARRELSISYNNIDPFYYTVIQAGLIPSKSLQEKRMVASMDIRDLREYGRLKHLKLNHPIRYKIKRSLNKYRKVKKTMYRAKDADELLTENISTYLEVNLLKSSDNTYRPLILIAPYPLDTNRLIDSLIEHDSRLFSRPIPHTTRPPFDWERDGFDYHFVSSQWFLIEVENLRFPEYGKFKDNYYGIHVSSIISVIEKGQLCLLNPNPRALKLLYCPAIKPYIVFLRPSYDLLFQKSSKFIPLCINSDYLPVKTVDLKQMALNSMKLEYLFSQYFDRILVVEEEEQIIKCLLDTVKLINIEDQWVPASWVPE